MWLDPYSTGWNQEIAGAPDSSAITGAAVLQSFDHMVFLANGDGGGYISVLQRRHHCVHRIFVDPLKL
jgi:hypothetical protein